MTTDASGEARFHPDDGCPLFSEALEQHLVAVSRGEAPNRGRFCGNCYTPIGRETVACPHCHEEVRGGRRPAETVPDEVMEALRIQRKTEARWVNGLAYLGLLIAVVGGIALVLAVPFFRERLIYATIVYAVILLIGGRGLAAILGGYYGDRIGFERARAQTRATWEQLVESRDSTG